MTGWFKHADHTIKRDGLVLYVNVARNSGVDWDQIVDPVHLHAMARVEDNRDVGVTHLIGKVAQLVAHGFYAEIGFARDDLEPALRSISAIAAASWGGLGS